MNSLRPSVPPFGKGGQGGISRALADKIPLSPPFSKGDFHNFSRTRDYYKE